MSVVQERVLLWSHESSLSGPLAQDMMIWEAKLIHGAVATCLCKEANLTFAGWVHPGRCLFRFMQQH
jgi:hypothetical protein